LKNKDLVLEKLRNKTAAITVAKEAAKIEEEIIKHNNIIRMNNMAKNIYEQILDKEYMRQASDTIDFLNNMLKSNMI